jgi:endonuclease/exonuclease/phosphatase (EEP) superfamily protein YafD
MRKPFAAVGPLTWAALAVAALTAESFLGRWWWIAALLVHFRPHLAAASLALLVLGIAARRPLPAVLCLVTLAVNGAPVLPYLENGAATRAAGPGNLRILELNMHGAGTDRQDFSRLVAAEHPDLVLLTEMPGDLDRVRRETPALPAYRVGDPPPSRRGVMLFSRWPVTRWSIDGGADGAARVLTAEICDTPEWRGCLRVVALHAPHPFGDGARQQREQLMLAADAAAGAPDHRSVLAGDFNMTPWAPEFPALLARGNLKDSALSGEFSATWLSRLPFVGLLIDHVLVSPGIAVLAYKVGDDVHSDHLPVIVDLAIPAEP